MVPLVADYVGRIGRFLPFEDVVLKADRDDRISQRILKESGRGNLLVALDEQGKLYDSRGFAQLVEGWMNRGLKQVTLVIGGADGLPSTIRKQADITIGLSRMTLPHRMARLMLVEQLYRALCIIRNVPYQK